MYCTYSALVLLDAAIYNFTLFIIAINHAF